MSDANHYTNSYLSLQLSTSINMPFNPYRPRRFPDPMNRSRFPVNPSSQYMPTMPVNAVPQRQYTPVTRQTGYQLPFTQAPASRNTFVQKQQYRATSQQPEFKLDTSYYQQCITPEEQSTNPWEMQSNQCQGLGLDMEVQSREMTPNVFDAGRTDSFEDLVKLDDVQPWAMKAASPDRQSWSSFSSADGASDYPDFTDMSSSTASSRLPSLDISFDNMTCQSLTPSPADRTRSSSVSTAAHSAITAHRSSSPDDLFNDFIVEDMEFPFQDASNMFNTNMFNPFETDMCDFTMPSIEEPKSQFQYDSMFSSAFGESFQHDGTNSVLPSTHHLALFHDHAPVEDDCEGKCHDSEAPNLFGPLKEEQSNPPPEDMNPEDPDLMPREQELRFEGDLYTPKWVRGHGNKREGWCGICKPGRWLVLKNSAFWYDKSFSHGVSAATGMSFEGPKKTRRMSGNPDVWEGLCGSCGDWIALISSKKKGTTWFRHAYKVRTIAQLRSNFSDFAIVPHTSKNKGNT